MCARWLCLINSCIFCFVRSARHANQQLAQQDSLSQWALWRVMQASEVYGVPTSPGYHECLPIWQMVMVLIKVIQSYSQNIVQWFYLGFSDSYPGLTGVDCSVVCPLIRLICLWGCCSNLSEVLSVTGVDFCKHWLSLILIFWVRFNTYSLAERRFFFQNEVFHI